MSADEGGSTQIEARRNKDGEAFVVSSDLGSVLSLQSAVIRVHPPLSGFICGFPGLPLARAGRKPDKSAIGGWKRGFWVSGQDREATKPDSKAT